MTFANSAWATVITSGGRIDCQTVSGYVAPTWPGDEAVALLHLDFLVEQLGAAEERVVRAGAVKIDFQPNSDHCLVFADPVGHPFCLTTLDEIG